MLTDDQLDHFRTEGYVRVPGAFSRELALELQADVWDELRREHGIERDDPSTWKQPNKSPRGTKELERNRALESEPFAEAISDLVGTEEWRRPPTWGGFLVTFPEPIQQATKNGWTFPPEDMWHWDWPPNHPGVLVISFYSTVEPGGGGTRILSGSHRLIDAYYSSLTPEERALPHKEHRKRFAAFDPWLAALMKKGRKAGPAIEAEEATVHGVECRVVELCGEPGDTVFCNLGILHSPSPNYAEMPRIMRVKFLTLEDG